MYAQLTRIKCTRDNCTKLNTAGNRKHCFPTVISFFISDDFKTLRLDCYQCETGAIPKQFTEVESVRLTFIRAAKSTLHHTLSNVREGVKTASQSSPPSPFATVLAKKEL